MNKRSKILALALCIALALSVVAFSACSSDSSKDNDSNTPDQGTSDNGDKTSANDTLLIGTGEFNGLFNYLFANSAYDVHIVSLTMENIFRVAPGGAMQDGICEYSDPVITKDADGKDITVYTFKVKDGVKWSDGTPVTADDIIFTYKCMAAPAYDGMAALYTYNIRGINEYRYDDPDYQKVIDQIDKDSKATPEELHEAAAEMAAADFDDPDYGPDGLIEDLGLKISAAPDSAEYKDEVIAAATKAYETDYADFFTPDIEATKKVELTTEYVAKSLAGGEKVPDIAGIVKKDDMTVEVTADGFDPTLHETLGLLPVNSEAYYGVGITKADFSEMKKKNGEPFGSGPYVFDKFENGVVYLHSNPEYFYGEPLIKNLRLQGVALADQLTAATSGTVDVMEGVTVNPENIELIDKSGKYPYLFDRNGWGYIGVSAKKLPDINVRKGLMHLMDRDTGVKTYYGDMATVLERPITMASWGYPVNANNRVYDYDVDKALEYFEKAGYTQKDGKLVDKSGAQVKFNAYIISQDHPVVPLFNQMKVDLEAMGAELAIEQIDWTTYNEMYQNGELMLWAAAYGDGSPDPDCYQMFHSDSIAAKNNPYYTNDPDVDRLIMEGRSLASREERQPIYDELYTKIMDTATVMPYYQRYEMFVVNPDVVDTDTLYDDPDPFFNFYENICTLKLK